MLDAATYAPIRSIAVGHQPRGFSLSPDGTRLFVANSWDDTISVIDTHTLEVVAIWPVGAEPSGVVEGPAGKYVFVANRISSDVAVLDAQTGVEEKRLMAGRGASYLTLSPDGQRIYATHIYPNPPALRTGLENRTPPESEITVIDARRAEVVDRIPLHSIAGVFHLALSADGRLGAVAEFHPKNLIPLAHLEHGGAFAYTLTLFGADVGKPVEIPLDELDRYASQPFGVAIAPDKSRLYVTLGGSEMRDGDRCAAPAALHPFASAACFRLVRVGSLSQRELCDRAHSGGPQSTRACAQPRWPQAVCGQPARRHFERHRYAAHRVLPQPSRLKGRRRSARCAAASRRFIPHTIPSRGRSVAPAAISIPRSMGCSGIWSRTASGATLWTTRLLEDIKDTEPYKWNGGNPNLPTECGPRTEKYFWRSENYDARTLTDLVVYVRSLPPRPNRWRLPDGELTPAQERGKAIFVRSVDKFGKPIPEANRCSYCHSGPKGTNQKSFDVGTTQERLTTRACWTRRS